MIKYLLRSDFPGIRVGPEPTTDKFIVVSQGDGHHVVPGHALVMDAQKPFTPLSKFGSSFLNRSHMLKKDRLPENFIKMGETTIQFLTVEVAIKPASPFVLL